MYEPFLSTGGRALKFGLPQPFYSLHLYVRIPPPSLAHSTLASLHRLPTLVINICVCLSVRVSNGVKSDSNCQSSHTGVKIESKMVRQKAVCSSTHLYVCIWKLESI